ncbi:phytanoyl-CoA dioxygenase family protein [Variovorax sp. J22R133]|uniref:phytanoyl-CoA dioxygenase family protein n=1 Tax=Variovorax brevis TaxID=3053503 RepID=UPI002578ECFA|nr:phytanoyl-CoA dioxygenase family protein [Variovorax sp. J22R133]MDM0112640.1 phytanoyl-CoA dioxygenase family protein [Variovorax sp. J22R133]
MLTDTQRLFFDVNGYVLLKGLLTPGECRALNGLAIRMRVDSPYARQDQVHQTVLYGPAWYDRSVLDLAMDARLRAPAEQIIGAEARLEENEFIVFHPPARRDASALAPEASTWHRGMKPGPGSFEVDGHYQCHFVKALAYLGDNGPQAGTWVIPGSHRMPCEVADVMRVADASLMRQVSPQPGDVLLFVETLMHASPRPAFDHDRLLLVIGYSSAYMVPWSIESDPPQAIRTQLSAAQRRFVFGEARYEGRQRNADPG